MCCGSFLFLSNAIKLLGDFFCVGILVALSLRRFRQWSGKTAVSILILWISSVADSLEMIEMSSRYHFNERAILSKYIYSARISPKHSFLWDGLKRFSLDCLYSRFPSGMPYFMLKAVPHILHLIIAWFGRRRSHRSRSLLRRRSLGFSRFDKSKERLRRRPSISKRSTNFDSKSTWSVVFVFKITTEM